MSKTAMLIAYHFPPVAVSSGVHRIVSLANALVAEDWDVTVLSASERTYERTDQATLSCVAEGIRTIRATAFDTAKHLSIKGKYSQWMALPDNLQSWIVFAIVKGLVQIRRKRPDVIISTYPIASAHIIALALHRLTGIPWVCDFRDPMAQPGYPSDPTKRKLFKWVESSAARFARMMVFATPGALAEYQLRYPEVAAERWLLVTNGYDERQYAGLSPRDRKDDEIRIVHSGLVYIHERNPEPLFQALSSLKKGGCFDTRKVKLVLRASGHEATYSEWIKAMGIEDIVELAPPISYREALQEMFDADGLLLMQGDGCNQQIPAKAYEYLRAQKPVLALTDEAGDTATLLKNYGMASIAPLNDSTRIEEAIISFVARIEHDVLDQAGIELLSRYSRKNISESWVEKISLAIFDTDGEQGFNKVPGPQS